MANAIESLKNVYNPCIDCHPSRSDLQNELAKQIKELQNDKKRLIEEGTASAKSFIRELDLAKATIEDRDRRIEDRDRKIETLEDNLDRARSEHLEQLRAIVQMLESSTIATNSKIV